MLCTGGEDFQLVFNGRQNHYFGIGKLAGITLIGEVLSGPPRVQW